MENNQKIEPKPSSNKLVILILILSIVGLLGVSGIMVAMVFKQSREIDDLNDDLRAKNAIIQSYKSREEDEILQKEDSDTGDKDDIDENTDTNGSAYQSTCANQYTIADRIVTFDDLEEKDTLTNPYILTGRAPGGWFFEATANVRIYDDEGEEIFSGYVMATSNWMVEDDVPFEGTLTFDPGDSKTGTLVFQADNPSGLKENCMEVIVPVEF